MYLETEKVKSTTYLLVICSKVLRPPFLIEPAVYEVKLDLTSYFSMVVAPVRIL